MNPNLLSQEDKAAIQARIKAMQSRLGYIRFANLLLPVGYLPAIGFILHHFGFGLWSCLPFFIIAVCAHVLVATRFWEVPR